MVTSTGVFVAPGVAIAAASGGTIAAGTITSCYGKYLQDNYNRLSRIETPDGKGGKNKIEFKKPKSHISDKEGAKNVPSWAKGNRPYKNESGKDFAKRLMDEKFGKNNYDKGTNSDFNKIKKWGDRAFE
jgi:hypothetical protein